MQTTTVTSGAQPDADEGEAAELNYQLGARYFRNGSYELARDRLLYSIELDPKNAVAHYTLAHADQLADLLADRPAKVNLIPFNPFAGTRFTRSPDAAIAAFQERLRERGLVTTTRKTRGDDIDAACGQLAGKVSDRVRNRLGEKNRRMATA